MRKISYIDISILLSEDENFMSSSPIQQGHVITILDKTDTVQSVKNILHENNLDPNKLQFVKNTMKRTAHPGDYLVIIYRSLEEANLAHDILSDPE